jgi:hypothetical protein
MNEWGEDYTISRMVRDVIKEQVNSAITREVNRWLNKSHKDLSRKIKSRQNEILKSSKNIEGFIAGIREELLIYIENNMKAFANRIDTEMKIKNLEDRIAQLEKNRMYF